MKRLVDWHLQNWKSNPRRKPLVLQGARQVGKTYAVRELGKSFESVVEVNFELLPEAKTIFENDLVPERIIWELGILIKNNLYFWKRESKGALAEVDYLYAYQGMVLPIEVKNGQGTTLRSMHQFFSEHPKSTYGIRFWAHNYSMMETIDSRPLYAVATLHHPDQKEAIQSLGIVRK